jgi:hypothetical protein
MIGKGLMLNCNKRILILTSSGGGGHIQAANAKELELIEKNYRYIIKKDVFLDFLGSPLGPAFAGAWNFCQTHGKIFSLYFFSISSGVVDVLISPILMVKMLYQLFKHDIDHIIDTQLNGTKVFLKSLRLVSKLKGKKITYEKILTDMPTPFCVHYFKPFLKLGQRDKKHLTVVTTKPYLEENQTEEQFWKKVSNLSLENISYKKFPLRPAFKLFKGADKPLTLSFNTNTASHTHTICKCLSFGNMPFIRGKNSITFTFTKETLSLITLGTFPQKTVLIDYMLEFIKQKNRFCKDRSDILFILVGPQKSSASFYDSIIKEIEKVEEYPKNLTIIPLSFQMDKVLAPLYYNLDFILAKSGGLTTMEIIESVNGDIFIHEGKLPKVPKLFSLWSKRKIDSMPLWERGNANFLMAKKGAKMITPNSFSTITNDFFFEIVNSVPASV